MTARIALAGATLALGTLAACSSSKAPAPAAQPAGGAVTAVSEGPDSITRSNLVTATATVEAVDVKKRLVTLRGEDGESTTIKVSDSVRNLPQVKKGDVVQASYYQSLVLQVRKPGEATPGVTASEGLERAAPGAKPAGAGASSVTVTTTVARIDRRKQTITLKTADGELHTMPVKDPANLDKVAVGDLLQITYTEAVGVSVEKAPKR